MIKLPPARGALPKNIFQYIHEQSPLLVGDYMQLYQPIDSKGRYLHFDAFRHRVPRHLNQQLAWAMVKLSRVGHFSKILPLGEDQQYCNFMLTPTIQKSLSFTDRNTTTAALEWMSTKIGEDQHFKYLLNDLIEDEAISSSQLEGAATTTIVAKDMLKRQRKPRTPDEKMIVGNFNMMRFAWDNRHKPLSTELICEMHRVGVVGIDDNAYQPGQFRSTDDIAVVDGEGTTVHTPPPAQDLDTRLSLLANWININHDNADTNDYIHPLIKAISLHFSIGFEHPFRDGNGRVARSLFYWFMFKSDYAAFRYIAISQLLKAAPVKYGHSYLYTETDEMDLTYFIDYQCGIILRAITTFNQAYQQSVKDIEMFNQWLWQSGLYKQLNEKQKTIFQVAKSGMAKSFTAASVKDNLGCSYNTAAQALNHLVDLGLFNKQQHGREWVFYMREKTEIVNTWR